MRAFRTFITPCILIVVYFSLNLLVFTASLYFFRELTASSEFAGSFCPLLGHCRRSGPRPRARAFTPVMASVTATTATSNDLLAQHFVLISRLKESQKAHRRKLRTLPSPPLSILNLSTIPSPKPSPPPSPPSSPHLLPRRKPPRADLQPPKRARAIQYENYVPEEETIRNDYSQRYVDGGEWPQNWVLGAEPERRFEEFVHSRSRLLPSKHRLLVCAYYHFGLDQDRNIYHHH